MIASFFRDASCERCVVSPETCAVILEPPAQSAFPQAVMPPDTKPRPVYDGSSPSCDEIGGSPHLGDKPTGRSRRGRWGWPWIAAESAIDLPRANLTVLQEMVLDLP
jgi:hypothetical protein